MTDFGLDISCRFGLTTLPFPDGSTRTIQTIDLAPGLAEISGRALLAEALIRRTVTRRGTLIDDPNYGKNVFDYINEDIGPGDEGRIGGEIESELRKDDRVLNARVVATFANEILTLECTVTDGKGPFRLVLRVDAVTVKILEAPR